MCSLQEQNFAARFSQTLWYRYIWYTLAVSMSKFGHQAVMGYGEWYCYVCVSVSVSSYFLISAKTSDRDPFTGMTWLPLTHTKHLGWGRDSVNPGIMISSSTSFSILTTFHPNSYSIIITVDFDSSSSSSGSEWQQYIRPPPPTVVVLLRVILLLFVIVLKACRQLNVLQI